MSPLAISLRFLQTQPDERLVALARDGHERAFEALVRRYRSRLLAYCRRVAPRGTSPEDILQQGLLQAWRALSSGAEVRDARAWLYRIVHNVAITALRAAGELPDRMIASTGAPGVEQVVEQRMAARDALAGLAALPDLQRKVMVSTALDGRSHEEIAAALGLSSGSVRGLIYRARSTLRAAAAAVIPAPVIDWALGDAGATTAGLAGAGSAGLGALILKGSAVLAIGAVAGTAAIVTGHRSHQAQRSKASSAAARAEDEAGTSQASATTTPGDAARAAFTFAGGAAGPASHDGGRDRSGDGRSPGGSGRDHSGDGGGPQQTGSDGGDGSHSGPGGPGGPGDGSPGGDDHSGSGSDGGGDPGATTATSGSDGGGDPGVTTTTSGRDGGSSSGSSDGGSFSGSFGGGGGSSGSSNGGGSDGGSDGGSSTTTTTTTSTTDGGH
jgi:RNA polymerase sigma factor (sigma-70 family)